MFTKKGILVILLFLAYSLKAQDTNNDFTQNLTISDGLAHNGVTTILNDSRGFIWFGTYDGLNRYDGYQIKTFKNSVGKNIISSNRIRALNEDINGNLWLGTDEGISIYRTKTNDFIILYSNELNNKGNKGPIVRDIKISKDKSLIICATENDGILVFNKDYTLKKQYYLPKGQSGTDSGLYSGIALDDSYFLYATSAGLLGFDLKTGSFNYILKENIDFCRAIASAGENNLIVALKTGFVVINRKRSTYDFEIISKPFLSDQEFGCISFDPLGHLWLGTLNEGAIRVDNLNASLSGGTLNQIKFKPEPGLLRISCFETTTNNGFWLGTFDKGLYRFELGKNPFKEFNGTLKYDFGVNNRHVRHITTLDDRRVYLTKNPGGLALFNTQTGIFEPIPLKVSAENQADISAIFIDSKKNTLLKIRDKGYFKVEHGQQSIKAIDSSTFPEFDKSVPFKITEDKFGDIWLSCREDVYRIKYHENGKVKIIESLNANSFFKKNKLSLVRYVYVDPKYDLIWLGTANEGLIRIQLKKDESLKKLKVNQYRTSKSKTSLPNNFVSTILRSNTGELWIGTEGAGISKVINSDKDPQFVTFSEKEGLSNNVVKSILFDKDNNLWVVTNIGLNKFFVSSQKFRKFRKEDGLPFEDFWYSSLHLHNGYFLLTGLEGFCYFKPQDILDKEALPNLHFGDLKILNSVIQPNDTIQGRVVLNKILDNTEHIKLKYDENVFSVEVISLHFSAVDNHLLRYRLTPIDKNWVEAPSNMRFINYNGLQPGNYTLEVQASNSIGDWTETKFLHISISPPWWKTILAYIFYVLLVFTILGIIFSYFMKNQTLRHSIVLEQVEKSKVKEVNAAKLRFFANLSHELKTPLNLISGPVGILSERFKGKADVEENLSIIQRQSRKITHLVDQMHDFERADSNQLEMNYSRFYFEVFLEELLVDFRFLATNNNKNLKVNGKNSDIVVSADRDKLEKVINNLLSNAFKYSSEKAEITIEYEANDKDLIISVSDTGKGIDAKDLPHIFERFYQSHQKNNIHLSGSGIGLAFSKTLIEMHYGYIEAQSELGKGTTILVRLPIVKKESEEDQERRTNTILFAEKQFSIQSQLELKVDSSELKSSGNYSDCLIYYAEDNPDMRDYVSKILSRFYRVKTFSDGQECLNSMEEEWPDLIISDVQMPILNGLDLCKKVKSDMATSHIPIILLTALGDIDDHIRGIRDGADAYIKKPFEVKQLVAQTEATLENKKRLRERYEVGIPLTYDNNINNRNDNAFLEKLYNLMAENLDNQDLDIDNFAKQLYLNRTHFFQKVKALTDHTPFDLMKTYRLKKAAEFLTGNKYTVNEVYYMTGFKSRTHFSKLFKEKYDVSPGKYEIKSSD